MFVPNNDWIWSVLEFEGIGCAPDNLSMAEFEAILDSQEKGKIMSWREVCEFGDAIEQTYNFLLVAVRSISDIIKPKEPYVNAEDYIFAIEAFDSTSWTVWSENADVVGFVRKIPGVRIFSSSFG